MDKVYLISQKQLDIIKDHLNSLNNVKGDTIEVISILNNISDKFSELSDDSDFYYDIFDDIETANDYIKNINDTKDVEFVIDNIENNQLVTELPYNSEKYNINMNITNKYSMGNLREV